MSEIEDYLDGLINREKQPHFEYRRLGLAPIRALLADLGNPQKKLKVLHIGGSKGKGSTALIAEALLESLEIRTGTFTSPHLTNWGERIRISGCEVSMPCLESAIRKLIPAVERLRQQGEEATPSFFDVITAAALLIFAEENVEVSILEVGMGGRLDSTNVVESAVSCLTSLELEHTRQLGADLASIAREKVEIARAGKPILLGRLPEEGAAVVRTRVEEIGALPQWLGKEWEVFSPEDSAEGSRVCFQGPGIQIETEFALLGRHQRENAALALACVAQLKEVQTEKLIRAASQVFPGMSLPGRIEVLSQSPWVVIDGAHTATSMASLHESLFRFPARNFHFVLSISMDKDPEVLFREILARASLVTVTRAEPTRSMPADQLAFEIQKGFPSLEVRQVPDPKEALRIARKEVGRKDLLCVTGSMYLAGIARQVLTS